MTGGDTPRPPYVGLRAFGTGDRDRFFGRTRESREVAMLWRTNRLTLLYGTSGVGKTSLLHAGVIPELPDGPIDRLPVGRLSLSRIQVAKAADVANPYTFALLSSWAPDRAPMELAGMTIARFVAEYGERTDEYGDPVPVLAAIDQGEELFSGYPHRQAPINGFVEQLAEMLRERQGFRLLVSLREDRLAAILPYEQLLAGRAHARFRLLPFDQKAALQAIRLPLEGTGRSFADEAAEHLVGKLRTIRVINAIGEETTVTADTVEPVQVQVVCSALWEALPPDIAVITAAHVEEHANVDRFLSHFCDVVLAEVATAHELPADLILSCLQRAFITELGTRGTAYEGLTHTAGLPNAVVRALEDRHMLSVEYRTGSRWYELQHDRLIEPLRQAEPMEPLDAARQALAARDVTGAARHVALAMRTASPSDLRTLGDAEAMLGEIARVAGRMDDALGHYRRAASLFEVLQDSPAVAEMLAGAGRLALQTGRYVAAMTDLSAALDRARGDTSVRTALALAMWHNGQPQPAMAQLNDVLEEDGEDLNALRLRGEIFADLGQADVALRDLDRVRSHQRPVTLAARALALATKGRLDAAAEEAADAVADAPRDGPVLLRAALVRAQHEDAAGAGELAARALRATEPRLPPHLAGEARRLAGAAGTDQREAT
jgi:tetratricopeptide (TPR) repeat protein